MRRVYEEVKHWFVHDWFYPKTLSRKGGDGQWRWREINKVCRICGKVEHL